MTKIQSIALAGFLIAGCTTETIIQHRPASADSAAPDTAVQDAAAPPGDTPRQPAPTPDPGPAPPDPGPVDPTACGAVTFAGCCQGTTLKYCQDDGTLKVVDCSVAPPPKVKGCGWDETFYNCENDNGPDPRGKHPIACP